MDNFKIKKITQKVDKPTKLPDGFYTGTWGGTLITVSYKGKIYELTTEYGIHATNVSVVVQIQAGKAIFNRLNT